MAPGRGDRGRDVLREALRDRRSFRFRPVASAKSCNLADGAYLMARVSALECWILADITVFAPIVAGLVLMVIGGDKSWIRMPE